MKDEMKKFFEQQKHKTTLLDDETVLRLAYLVDIYTQVNKVNLYLQGNNKTLSDITDKLTALQTKLLLWKGRVVAGNLEMFEIYKKQQKNSKHLFQKVLKKTNLSTFLHFIHNLNIIFQHCKTRICSNC